jgi:hypothetical protein
LSSNFPYRTIKIKIHRIVVLPVVYGYETWLLALREECRLRVFENRVLRRIFGANRDEVTGEWRKLRNEELSDLTQYFLGDKIEKKEMGGACSAYGGEERNIQGFCGKPEGKRPLGRPRHGWEDISKMDR